MRKLLKHVYLKLPKKIKFTPRNLPPWFDSEIRLNIIIIKLGQRLKSLLLEKNIGKFRKVTSSFLKENLQHFWFYIRSKTKHLNRKTCHKGLRATNPNDMAWMFFKYFELAFNNNISESLAVPNIVEK